MKGKGRECKLWNEEKIKEDGKLGKKEKKRKDANNRKRRKW